MKNKFKSIFKILIVTAACLWFASFSPSLDGRAVVVDGGVFPQGLFAKTVGYLPGDIISVTNIAGDTTVDLLVIGALDPSEGVAIMLSPEAAQAIGIDKTSNNIVKITKRSGQDERVYGNAVISKSAESADDVDDSGFETIGAEENSDAFAEAEETAEAEPETSVDESSEATEAETETDFEENTEENEAEEEDFEEENFEEEEAFVDEETVETEEPVEENVEEETVEEEAIEEAVETEEPVETEAEEEFTEEAEETTEPEDTEENFEEEAFEEEELEAPAEKAEEEAFEPEELEATAPVEEETEVPEETEIPEETEEAEEFVEETVEPEEPEVPAEEFEEESFEAEEPEAPAEAFEEESFEAEEPEAPAEAFEEESFEAEEPEVPAEAFEEESVDEEVPELAEESGEEEYEAIVLVPADSNPPVSKAAEEADDDEVIDLIVPDDIDSIDEEVEVVEKESEIKETEVVKEEASKEVKVYDGSYDKYLVPSLSALESGKYYIQIAVYKSDENINEVISTYGTNYPITVVPMAGGVSKQVLIGPLSMDEYKVVLERFKSYGFKDAFLRKVR